MATASSMVIRPFVPVALLPAPDRWYPLHAPGLRQRIPVVTGSLFLLGCPPLEIQPRRSRHTDSRKTAWKFFKNRIYK
jgi:hypothetical protein